MALTLSSMQTELYARGFSYLNDGGAGVTRVTRFLNDAMHLINEMEDWPYLNTTTTGTAPLTIADLRTVESVTDVSNLRTITPADRRDLRASYADLTQAGIPSMYFITGGTTINVYPASTSTTLTVDYWKFGPDLSAPSDPPLMPDRFRMAIVHYAVEMAHRDAANDAAAAAAKQDGDVLVASMASSLLNPQHQGSSQFVQAVGDDL